jgi:hypothetical protein
MDPRLDLWQKDPQTLQPAEIEIIRQTIGTRYFKQYVPDCNQHWAYVCILRIKTMHAKAQEYLAKSMPAQIRDNALQDPVERIRKTLDGLLGKKVWLVADTIHAWACIALLYEKERDPENLKQNYYDRIVAKATTARLPSGYKPKVPQGAAQTLAARGHCEQRDCPPAVTRAGKGHGCPEGSAVDGSGEQADEPVQFSDGSLPAGGGDLAPGVPDASRPASPAASSQEDPEGQESELAASEHDEQLMRLSPRVRLRAVGRLLGRLRTALSGAEGQIDHALSGIDGEIDYIQRIVASLSRGRRRCAERMDRPASPESDDLPEQSDAEQDERRGTVADQDPHRLSSDCSSSAGPSREGSPDQERQADVQESGSDGKAGSSAEEEEQTDDELEQVGPGANVQELRDGIERLQRNAQAEERAQGMLRDTIVQQQRDIADLQGANDGLQERIEELEGELRQARQPQAAAAAVDPEELEGQVQELQAQLEVARQELEEANFAKVMVQALIEKYNLGDGQLQTIMEGFLQRHSAQGGDEEEFDGQVTGEEDDAAPQ